MGYVLSNADDTDEGDACGRVACATGDVGKGRRARRLAAPVAQGHRAHRKAGEHGNGPTSAAQGRRARCSTSPLQWLDGSDLLAHSSACASAMHERAAMVFADEIEDDEPTAHKRSVIEEITIHIMAR